MRESWLISIGEVARRWEGRSLPEQRVQVEPGEGRLACEGVTRKASCGPHAVEQAAPQRLAERRSICRVERRIIASGSVVERLRELVHPLRHAEVADAEF